MNIVTVVTFLADAATAADASAAGGTADGLLAAGFALLAIGAVLAFTELFVPTGGLLAIGTAVCLVASVVLFFMHSPVWGFAALLSYCAGAPLALVYGFKLWARSPVARRMVLGGTDADDEEGAPIRGDARTGVHIGDTGTVITGLRPVGTARFGTERVEVLSEIGFVDAGAEVEVVAVDGPSITVRARG
jgi:membrane-bound serine protease (ClpP class)